MKPTAVRIFWTIILTTFICLIINLPPQISLGSKTLYRPNFNFKFGQIDFKPNLDLRLGLDLSGGASLIYSVDTSKVKPEAVATALESLKGNIERRVNLFGVSEANVQLSRENNQNRLKIELPGVENVNQAIELIGQTAQLSFKGLVDIPPEATATATLDDYLKDVGINGSHLVSAKAVISPNDGKPEVAIEFNGEGTKLFAAATKEYLNKPILIFLDDYIVTRPVVQSVITDGQAVINGSFDQNSAKTLAIQLNAGALPLPISLIQQTQIGATLGKDTITKGVTAGLIGLVLVAFFMIGNYGRLGLISVFGLIIYGLIILTLYRLIPITLTFPGIVGFILSVGMAVDSNILIFARMKEELLDGKPWNQAMELGFGRAWDSIKDANTCTIITGLILFNPLNWPFLNTSGMVRGFAVTLLLGIIIGIFTGVFVTRNLLRVLAKNKT
ncbi:MAG: protein translocase subunit SecD [Candidatus Shapirobacteria bacterium]|jgi:preprotein translocase subunit SecD